MVKFSGDSDGCARIHCHRTCPSCPGRRSVDCSSVGQDDAPGVDIDVSSLGLRQTGNVAIDGNGTDQATVVHGQLSRLKLKVAAIAGAL